MAETPERTDVFFVPYRDFNYPRLLDRARTGRWRADADHFHVEEMPLYPFAGDGEHAALRVEKRGKTTRDVAAAVARELGLGPAAVGYAGMKDKAAVTVQGFTVTGADETRARKAFEIAGCRVLEATRHRNKLRLGHLAANRFRVFLEGADEAAASAALAELARRGAPNYFGPQRFGAAGDNAARGVELLRGKKKVSRWKRDLLVSAVQALVFNEVVARRIENGIYDAALPGDLLQKSGSKGIFLCEDPGADQPRFERFEVSPTGPMHGRKMKEPEGAVHETEQDVLTALGLKPELFAKETGARRPLRAPVMGGVVEAAGEGLWLEFACPPGVYATVVVNEIAESGAVRL